MSHYRDESRYDCTCHPEQE
ncbi:unnamed protein product [Acanthoscelides obtectus]|uniref:Uncharacterized protein n=1 Tax=Acanthoscelides obtectus TaxID=200917 RepID=A0A9P0LEQ7_ACAOB|nr:unnamed protein product [Acanthoscelides obtectus]CAK1631731.1 hypothetical protein AOBTE_LOCUS7113 [Acanthoscelides obtectus]